MQVDVRAHAAPAGADAGCEGFPETHATGFAGASAAGAGDEGVVASGAGGAAANAERVVRAGSAGGGAAGGDAGANQESSGNEWRVASSEWRRKSPPYLANPGRDK